MAKLAIKGHATRGKEVIALLEMLGGKNIYNNNTGFDIGFYYSIEDGGIRSWECKYGNFEYMYFTLEEFLEKYPYKVGDKVNYVKYNDGHSSIHTIQKMQWTGATIEYLLDSNGFSALTKDLQPYKEETMEEIKIDIPKGYEFAGIDDNRQQVVFTKIQPEYPKTYEECEDILELEDSIIEGCIGYEYKLLNAFQKLLMCRDAYWKLAGKQMGLDKPWKIDWNNICQEKWFITTFDNTISCDFCNNHSYVIAKHNHILTFPTKEMRDVFLKNFKELIEKCKELL